MKEAMENKKSLNYLRAKKKVKILKDFYGHIAVFIIVNGGIALASSTIFGHEEPDLSRWGIYASLFFWGIGLISHAIYVLFMLYFKSNFLKRWEENKIEQFLEKDNF